MIKMTWVTAVLLCAGSWGCSAHEGDYQAGAVSPTDGQLSVLIAAVELLSHGSVLRARMSVAAVASAQLLSWDAVFEGVYAAYQTQGSTPAPAFSTMSTLTGERRTCGGSHLR